MNPYEVLNVNEDADKREIKKAYHKKASSTHPDKGGSPDEFKTVSLAYDILSDPLKRREYDTAGKIPKNPELEKEAANMVLQLFDIVLSHHGHGCNIVDKIEHHIREKIAQIPLELSQINKQRDQIRRLKIRIKQKEDSEFPDVIGLALENNLLDLSIKEKELMEFQKTLKIAKRMIGMYDCSPSYFGSQLPGLFGGSFESVVRNSTMGWD